ncbi:hypothetical protein V1478_007343 [Vespula squamosa]|uniref:Uncharacterized protein n=1 Tax=Vespula squamosa TaxID=30214 RepID=A0ABD2B2X8_VESSQ
MQRKRKENLPNKSRNVVCPPEIQKGYTKCFLARFQSSSNVTDSVCSEARGDRSQEKNQRVSIVLRSTSGIKIVLLMN